MQPIIVLMGSCTNGGGGGQVVSLLPSILTNANAFYETQKYLNGQLLKNNISFSFHPVIVTQSRPLSQLKCLD